MLSRSFFTSLTPEEVLDPLSEVNALQENLDSSNLFAQETLFTTDRVSSSNIISTTVAKTLTFGSSDSDRINSPNGQEYTFDANAGDRISIRMSEITTAIEPQIRLYDPSGQLVTGGEDSGSFLAELSALSLNAAGTYTLITSDVNGDEVGDYSLSLQRTNNPGQTTAINYGQSVLGRVDPRSELSAYTFDASAGDRISIRMSEITTAIEPQIRLYDPSGQLVTGGEDSGSFLAEFSALSLNAAGTYTLITSDVNGDEVGDYSLSLNRIPTSVNVPPVVLNPIAAQNTDEDSLFQFQFAGNTFNDPDGDALTYTTNTLPAWLTFDAPSRTFRGTPINDNVNTFTITVIASDSNGGSVNTTFDLTVNNTNDAPTLVTTLPDQTATVGQSFRFIMPANTFFQDVDNGNDPAHSLTLNATLDDKTVLPSWLRFNTSTLSSDLTGTPTASDIGTLSVKVVATDNVGASISDIFDIQVIADNTIRGTTSDDFLEGTPEDDTIDGLTGDDHILGHWGDDELIGGTGNDKIFGNWGDDLLSGGLGNDDLKGGPGHDRFILQTGNGLDTILDYQDGRDKLVLKGSLTFGQLTIAQQTNQVLISVTATNEQLALLNQTTVSQIGSSDFVVM